MENDNDVQELVTPEAEIKETAQTIPYERFSHEVAKRKALEERLAALETKQDLPTQEPKIQFDALADNLAVLKPLEEDEVNELRSQAKELGVDPIKFAQSKAWKAHLETLRVNKRAEAKTPESSHRTAVFEGKTYAEVLKDSASTPETKQKAYQAHIDAALKRGRNQMI